jgi:hypothetical protein
MHVVAFSLSMLLLNNFFMFMKKLFFFVLYLQAAFGCVSVFGEVNEKSRICHPED